MREEITTLPKGRRKVATVNDVAELAGVSKGTVSKVLNGKAGISPSTREQVEVAARKLAFRPNPLARGLLEGKTGTVGLLTNDLEGRFSLPILMGAEDALGAGKLSVFLCDARGDSIREQYHLEALLNRRVDGLIVVGYNTEPRQSLGRNLPVPIVYAYAPSLNPGDTSVIADNYQAGRMGINHLLSAGRKNIAYVGGDHNFVAATQRAAGAEREIAEAGLKLAMPPIFGPWSEAWGRTAARTVLDSAPEVDAIMCGSDQIARGVMDTLIESGRRIPGDVAVLGHDNWQIFAREARPPLSSIDMNLEKMGQVAAQLLFSAMGGEHKPGIHAINGKVVTRGSTI